MLSTVKNIFTVKASKPVATGINAISYGFNTIVLTENELIKRGLNTQYYEIVRDYVSEMEYEQWTQ